MTMAAAGGMIALGGGYAQADAVADGGASNSPGVLSGNNVQAPVHVPVNVCGNTVNAVALLNPAMGNTCTNGSSSSGHGDAYGGGGGHQGGGGSQASGGTSDSPGVASGNNVQAPVHVPVNVCGNTATIGGLGNATTGNDCANQAGPAWAGNPDGPRSGNPGHPGTPADSDDSDDSDTSDQSGSEGEEGGDGAHGSDDSGAAGEQKGDDQAKGGAEDEAGTPAKAKGEAREADKADDAGVPGGQDVARAASAAELAGTGTNGMGLIIPAGAGLLLGGAVLYRRARANA